MKRISIKNYQESMGILIDVSNPLDFLEHHDPRARNIPYNQLMLHYREYLKKEYPYYLICKKGVHSSKAVAMLEYLGYDVTQVMNTI